MYSRAHIAAAEAWARTRTLTNILDAATKQVSAPSLVVALTQFAGTIPVIPLHERPALRITGFSGFSATNSVPTGQLQHAWPAVSFSTGDANFGVCVQLGLCRSRRRMAVLLPTEDDAVWVKATVMQALPGGRALVEVDGARKMVSLEHAVPANAADDADDLAMLPHLGEAQL